MTRIAAPVMPDQYSYAAGEDVYFPETAVVYSASECDGQGQLVYLSGNISKTGYWSNGIFPWSVLQGIGGFVVVTSAV